MMRLNLNTLVKRFLGIDDRTLAGQYQENILKYLSYKRKNFPYFIPPLQVEDRNQAKTRDSCIKFIAQFKILFMEK